MNWAREIALKIIEERPDLELYTVASGVSPSGYVHIGNFREIATPYLIAKELKNLGKNVRYILSLDEYDRFRKVPGNIPKEYEKYIGMPYTELPSLDDSASTYAEFMENRFLSELKAMDIEVECIYQTKEYKSLRYNKYIKVAMDRRKEIFNIIDSFRTQDAEDGEIDKYYPITIYCPKCRKDNTEVISYDEKTGSIEYKCSCGHHETINLDTADNVKLKWKIDWPMRWMVEKVTFETGGIDHSAANGSKAVSERIAREIYNYEPPVYIPYNFIGIKGGGAKMSSSTGNVLTLTDLLKVYDKNIIWWFYAKYRPNQAFDIALDNDVIRYYQEFDRWVKLYFEGNIDDKNKAIIESTGVTKDYLNNPNFSYMATFLPMVGYDKDKLKVLLEKEGIDCNNKYFDERYEKAKHWVETYGTDYQIKLVDSINKGFYETLNDEEREWVSRTIDILNRDYEDSNLLQTDLYALIREYYNNDEKELKAHQKRYFQILYNLLLNKDSGPKMGLLLLAIPKEEIINLLTF